MTIIESATKSKHYPYFEHGNTLCPGRKKDPVIQFVVETESVRLTKLVHPHRMENLCWRPFAITMRLFHLDPLPHHHSNVPTQPPPAAG